MDAMDKYIARLSEPAVHSYWRRINLIHYEDGITPGDGTRLSQERVDEAEKELGFILPPSYRKLLTSSEPYDGFYGVTWLADRVSRDTDRFPHFLFAVVEADGGDAYCFDLRHPDERGEYPIVHFDHEVHGYDSTESTKFETVSRDLGEFLLGSLGGESAT